MQCSRPGFDPWAGKISWRWAWQPTPVFLGFPGDSYGKESTCSMGDLGSIPGLGKSPGGGHGNPLQDSCLGNPHGQRNLVGYCSWGQKKSDMTEWLSAAKHIYICIIESLCILQLKKKKKERCKTFVRGPGNLDCHPSPATIWLWTLKQITSLSKVWSFLTLEWRGRTSVLGLIQFLHNKILSNINFHFLGYMNRLYI